MLMHFMPKVDESRLQVDWSKTLRSPSLHDFVYLDDVHSIAQIGEVLYVAPKPDLLTAWHMSFGRQSGAPTSISLATRQINI